MIHKLTVKLGSAMVLVLAVMAGAAWGAERLPVPQETVLPLYVSGLGHTGLGPDDLVGTAFYYPPDKIPGNFELWNAPVYRPPVGVVTPYVEGFLVVDDPNSPPIQMVLHNAPGARVPIWFTRVGDWTGSWTVRGMLKQEPLIGWADSYQEVYEPQPDGLWHGLVVASGVMEDGRSFWVKSEVSAGYFQNALTADCTLHFGP